MFNAIIDFFETLGKARAASQLARLGRYDLAKQIMLNDKQEFEVHP
jgi:hypothetical protein